MDISKVRTMDIVDSCSCNRTLSSDLKKLVWIRYDTIYSFDNDENKSAGVGMKIEKDTFWWPAIMYQSHVSSTEHQFESTHPFLKPDPLERMLTINTLEEVLERTHIPVIVVHVPLIHNIAPKWNDDGTKVVRRRIPILTKKMQPNVIVYDFLEHLLLMAGKQTKETLGSELYPSYTASLECVMSLLSSGFISKSSAQEVHPSIIPKVPNDSESTNSIVSFEQSAIETSKVGSKVKFTMVSETDTIERSKMDSTLDDYLPRGSLDCKSAKNINRVSMESCAPKPEQNLCESPISATSNSTESNGLSCASTGTTKEEDNVAIDATTCASGRSEKLKLSTSKILKNMEKFKAKKTASTSVQNSSRKRSDSDTALLHFSSVADASDDYDLQSQPSTDHQSKEEDSCCSNLSSSASSNSVEVVDKFKYHWKVLWPELKRNSWTYVKAKNPLHDWYYVPPYVDIHSSTINVDYFTSPTAVIEYVKAQDRAGKTSNEYHAEEEHDEPKKRLRASYKKKNSSLHPSLKRCKNDDVSSEANLPKKTKTTSKTSTKGSNHFKQHGTAVTNNETQSERQYNYWFKKETIPDFLRDIWPILKKLDFIWINGKYTHSSFPPEANSANTCTIREYMCRYGIPNLYDNDNGEVCQTSALDKFEKEQLYRWITFANVPVTLSNQKNLLHDIQIPSDIEIVRLLLLKLDFHKEGNRFYPPGVSTNGNDKKLVRGIHYFEGLQETRDFIRCSSTLRIDMGQDKYRSVGLRRGSNHNNDGNKKASARDELIIRVWAALSPTPLPKFEKTCLRHSGQSSLVLVQQTKHELNDDQVEQRNNTFQKGTTVESNKSTPTFCDFPSSTDNSNIKKSDLYHSGCRFGKEAVLTADTNPTFQDGEEDEVDLVSVAGTSPGSPSKDVVEKDDKNLDPNNNDVVVMNETCSLQRCDDDMVVEEVVVDFLMTQEQQQDMDLGCCNDSSNNKIDDRNNSNNKQNVAEFYEQAISNCNTSTDNTVHHSRNASSKSSSLKNVAFDKGSGAFLKETNNDVGLTLSQTNANNVMFVNVTNDQDHHEEPRQLSDYDISGSVRRGRSDNDAVTTTFTNSFLTQDHETEQSFYESFMF